MVNSFHGESSSQDKLKSVPPHSCCLKQGELEDYIFNRLVSSALDRVEEHLLVCTDCQDRLQEEEEFIAAFREVAPTAAPVRLPQQQPSWAARLAELFAAPMAKPAFAAAGALALVLTIWVPNADSMATTSQSVTLQVVRGGALLDSALVSSRNVVELNIDLKEIAAQPSYRVELVKNDGQTIDQKSFPGKADMLTWKLGRKLNAGNYWVRLHSGSDNSQLREFQLRVE